MPTDKIFDLEVFDVTDAGVCTADGGFVGDVTGDVTGDITGLISGPATSYIADGAIGLTDSFVFLKSASASTVMTLALTAGTQRMTIVAFNYSNTMTVTADFGGAITTATFSAEGEAIDLLCDTNAWYVVGNNGVVLS